MLEIKEAHGDTSSAAVLLISTTAVMSDGGSYADTDELLMKWGKD